MVYIYQYFSEKAKDISIKLTNSSELFEFVEAFADELDDLNDVCASRLKSIVDSDEAMNYIFDELMKDEESNFNLYELMYDLRFNFLVIEICDYEKVREKCVSDITKEEIIDYGERVILYGEFIGEII